MDLKSGYPYFFLKNGLGRNFNTLKSDYSAEVVILGGGISGALVAYELIENGVECMIIDKRSPGMGSTCASTSLLQYEIDVPLHQLAKQIGKQDAMEAYKLCSESIDKIKSISEKIGYDGFKFCESLYFQDSSWSSAYLKKEFEIRKEAGFEVKYLHEDEIKSHYGFKSKAAILSKQAGKIDAYKFTQLLHEYNIKRGCKIFENTCIEKIMENESGVELITEQGFCIKTKKLIYATGYEFTEQISKSIVKLESTYALSTERIEGLPDFFKNSLLWNTADPYLYMREDNGRLIIGGRDENYYDPKKRDVLLEKKAGKLEDDFRKIFPHIEIKKQFFWTGTFGSTKDGLPYIGAYPGKPNSYFALGFGGNGITFSVIAAEMITKIIKDQADPVPKMFSFNR